MSFDSTLHQLDSGASLASEPPPFLEDANPIALYGAGSMGRDLMRVLRGKGRRVSFFLDRKAQAGSEIEGIPIMHPEDPRLATARADTHAVVSIYNYGVDMLPILDALQGAGWRSVTSVISAYHAFSSELGSRYWLGPLSYYKGKGALIAEAHGLWGDDKSRRLYEAVFEYRLSGDVARLPEAEETQYFPKDLPPWKTPLRLVDCGAFDGDTLRAIEQAGIEAQAILSFEPDEANFHALVAQSRASYFSQCEITCIPCGVHSETGQLRFSSGLGSGSGITAGGGIVIQCVSLDDCMGGFRPNLIKMDIEGAEYDALQGASRTIAKARPGLAICIYHRPDDIWRIPLLLRDWNLGYRLYLRNHAYNGFDIVAYAVPSSESH